MWEQGLKQVVANPHIIGQLGPTVELLGGQCCIWSKTGDEGMQQ